MFALDGFGGRPDVNFIITVFLFGLCDRLWRAVSSGGDFEVVDGDIFARLVGERDDASNAMASAGFRENRLISLFDLQFSSGIGLFEIIVKNGAIEIEVWI